MERKIPLHVYDEIVGEYLRGDITSDISVRHGVSASTIYKELRRRNIPVQRHAPSVFLTDKDKEDIERLYIEEGLGTHTLAKIFGVYHPSIGKILKNRGVAMREGRDRLTTRYKSREDFFNVVDTEEKAYWLGFIAADGNVLKSRLNITLQASDGEHLEKFRQSLESEVPVKFFTKPNGRQYAAYVHQCPQIIKDLKAQGIEEKKSLILLPWEGPSHLMRHYWRGVIDGDGCIGWSHPKTRNGHWKLYLVGSQFMCESFACFVQSVTGIFPYVAKRKNIWVVHVVKGDAVKRIVSFLYGDATISLARKAEKAVEVENWQPNNPCRFVAQKREHSEEIASLYAGGCRTSVIAKKFEISDATVLNIVREMGVPVRRSGPLSVK